MQFNAFYEKTAPVISFEVFPPTTEQSLDQLYRRLPRLADLKPSFITVTYGAFGGARERTLQVAASIKQDLGLESAHHLTCVGSSRDEIDRILESIQERGIENIVALRGDPPKGESRFEPVEGGFRYASELVEHIRRRGDFGIAVAGYPEKHVEAPDFKTDLLNLKHKVEAGADVIITQLFYDNRLYFDFVTACREVGIQVPIVPGLLPILSTSQIKHITQMCGASLPQALLEELEEAGDDESSVHQIGIQHTSEQAAELLESGVPGIHFYVLNRHFHITEVMRKIQPSLGRH